MGSLEETAFARLLATGEEVSAAFLALALSHAGVVTRVLDADRIGFATSGDLIDGYPTSVDTGQLMLALSQLEVAIVPGFVARNTDNEISLLGRGGSDLSAVYIAHAVRALECRLLKDVDGVYTGDPRSGRPVRRYEEATWEDVMRDGPQVVQPKAVRLARRLNRPFTVCALGSSSSTRVGGYRVSRTSPLPATVTGVV